MSTAPFTQWRDCVMFIEIAWYFIAYISHSDCDILYSILEEKEPVMPITRPPALLMNVGVHVVCYFRPQSL